MSQVYEQKLVALLRASSAITDDLADGVNGIYPSDSGPIGENVPCVTFRYDPGESETVLPATRGILTIEVWCGRNQSNYYSFLRNKQMEIDDVINKKPEAFTDTDENIRVVHNVRNSSDIAYDRTLKMYFVSIEYDVVESEDESFEAADAGDQEWI